MTALAVELSAWSKLGGVFAFITVASLAICGFWVMAAHNAAHRQKLAELAIRMTKTSEHPRPTLTLTEAANTHLQ